MARSNGYAIASSSPHWSSRCPHWPCTARTLQPDVGFWDTAEFQAIGPVLGIAHPTGYPAYTLLAWLASVVLQPFGNEALRANLLSAHPGCGRRGRGRRHRDATTGAS